MTRKLAKIMIMGVLIIMSIGLFAGCESSQEKQIREDWVIHSKEQWGVELAVKDVRILKNYGKYSGATVVLMDRMASQALTSVEVDGVVFRMPNSNMPLVWKESKFYELQEAFDAGVLTNKDLKALAKKVNK